MTAADVGWRPSERLVLGALAVSVAVVIGVGIRRPLFIDEAFSVLTASSDIRGILDRLRTDNNLPLYFYLLHWWIAVAGISEIALRVPSIACYVAATAVCYLIGRELASRRYGLYAAVFFAASLQAIHLAQKVRGYSLMGVLAALSTWLFLRAFSDRPSSTRDRAAFVVVNAAGTFTHVWFVFLLIAEGVCGVVFWRRAAARLTVALAISVVPFVALWGPTLRAQLANGASDWIAPVTPWSPVGALLEFFGGWPAGAMIAAGLVVIAFVTERGGVRSASPWTRPVALLFGTTVAVPLAVSVLKPIYWPGRYTVIALPALAVWLSLMLVGRVKRDALAAFALLLMAAAVSLHVSTRDRVIENSDAMLAHADSDRHAADELIPRLAAGDMVIFTGLTRASVEYYLRRSGRDETIDVVSYPSANATHLGWNDSRVPESVLEAEAAMLIQRLGTARPGRRIWVVAGQNDVANRILAGRLNAQFGPPDVFNWRGAFFSAVVAYPRVRSGG